MVCSFQFLRHVEMSLGHFRDFLSCISANNHTLSALKPVRSAILPLVLWHIIVCILGISVINVISCLQNSYSCIIYNDTGQQRFSPMRKNVCFDVFLNAEFKYFSRISLSPTPFVLHQTM